MAVTQPTPSSPPPQPHHLHHHNHLPTPSTSSPQPRPTMGAFGSLERTVELDEGQAGSDPGKTLESRPPPKRVLIEEDQAGSNPGQSHVAQAGPNHKPMHEDFISIVYPAVHESLKLTTEEQVYIENPPSSIGTLLSMKNLEDAFTIGDQFLNDKSIEEELGKANVETEVESMVIVPIHQASSSVPPLPTPIINLSPPKPVSPHDKITQSLASRFYKLEHHDLYSKIDKQVNVVVKEAVYNALQAPLHECFRDLSEFKMKEILHDWFFESNSYISHLDHTTLYKALEASMQHDNNDELHEELTKSRKRRHDDQDPPPPPPKDSDQSKKKKHDSYVSVSKQPLADALAKTYKDLEENKLLQKTIDMGSFINWYCKQIRKKKIVKADFEGQAYKIVRSFHKNSIPFQFQMEKFHLLLTDQVDLINPEGNWVVHDMSKPLPLVGPPGQVTIHTQYFFNKDLEYLVSGNKKRRHALLISKLKATYYLDFEVEELVPSLWTKSESAYDISSAYGISHWWFKRKEFHITRHSAPSDRNAVRSHIRILSVISKADFKNLHPNDFEDMYLLHFQGNLNHLSRADKVHLSTAVNLWTRNIVIRQRVEYLQLEDYTIFYKPRAIIYRDRNDQKKMMRETEVHKFSDGTLTRIMEKLDYMVKDYELFKYNPGMESRI
ncbi:hypothetical protein Tco_0316150 [Tanacetum coccineum]